MARGRGHRENLEEQVRDLNLIPYLDVMVNLVLFTLVTITSILSVTILTASIPQIAPDSGEAKKQLQKAQLLLMIRVMEKQLIIDPNVQGGPSPGRSVLQKKPEGFDFVMLKDQVGRLKKQFPEETRVLIIAEPKIVY